MSVVHVGYCDVLARILFAICSDIMLINEGLEVRDYEQIKGSRTQAAITTWVKTGHQSTKPKGFGLGIPGFEYTLISFSPMSPLSLIHI